MSSGSVHTTEVPSFIAKTAMANKYAAVKQDTAINTVALATAATDEVIGFIQEEQETLGHAVPVRVTGYTLAKAGTGGWTKGDKLTASTAGTLVTTTTAAHKVCAIALDTVSADELGEVRIVSPALRYDSF